MTCVTRDGTEQGPGQTGRNHVPHVTGERPPTKGLPAGPGVPSARLMQGPGAGAMSGHRNTLCSQVICLKKIRIPSNEPVSQVKTALMLNGHSERVTQER